MRLALYKLVRSWTAISLMILTGCQTQTDETVNVAVATNFYLTAQSLETAFEKQSGFDVTLISGSTGQLYAQIKNGAPHHIFLSADQERAIKLVEEGFANERFTYAIGRLVLWRPDDKMVSLETLMTGNFRRLAMANPALAPYGRAAQEVIATLDISDKIVMGENIGQVYSLIKTGNADLGFIAYSQIDASNITADDFWAVPSALYSPIIQDAVMLKSGTAQAQAFYKFLKSDTARDIIQSSGYDIPDAK